MPDCFISYSSVDDQLARFVADQLAARHVGVFVASVSLQPGEKWSEAIWSNLKASQWVVFLASRTACRSAYAQQELGAAMGTGKKIIPIVWDMPPQELPGWLNQRQALDLRGRTWEDVASRIGTIAEAIKADKLQGALIAGAILAGLLWLASSK